MPNMSNNTSLYDYYNHDNFKVEHAPHNFAAQPKRLLPEQINMNISKDKDEYKDSKSEGESKDEGKIGLDTEKGNKSGMTDQITDGARKFGKFFMDIFDDKPEQKDPVSAPAPFTTPTPFATPTPLATAAPVPAPAPLSAPAPAPTNPPNANNVHIGGESLRPTQLGGGEYNMDVRSLMRKNRMLQNRIHELERDMYKSSH